MSDKETHLITGIVIVLMFFIIVCTAAYFFCGWAMEIEKYDPSTETVYHMRLYDKAITSNNGNAEYMFAFSFGNGDGFAYETYNETIYTKLEKNGYYDVKIDASKRVGSIENSTTHEVYFYENRRRD